MQLLVICFLLKICISISYFLPDFQFLNLKIHSVAISWFFKWYNYGSHCIWNLSILYHLHHVLKQSLCWTFEYNCFQNLKKGNSDSLKMLVNNNPVVKNNMHFFLSFAELHQIRFGFFFWKLSMNFRKCHHDIFKISKTILRCLFVIFFFIGFKPCKSSIQSQGRFKVKKLS